MYQYNTLSTENKYLSKGITFQAIQRSIEIIFKDPYINQ